MMGLKFNYVQVWLRLMKLFDIKALYGKTKVERGLVLDYNGKLAKLPMEFKLSLFQLYLENIRYYDWQRLVLWLQTNNILIEYVKAMVHQHDNPYKFVESFQDERACNLLTLTLYWQKTPQGHEFWYYYHNKLHNDLS